MKISKSQFIRGLQCPKSLWLLKNRPELRDVIDTATQARFEAGTDIGMLAQKLFPHGEAIQFDSNNFKGMLHRTKELISKGKTTIYEAAFSFDNIFVMVDILHKGINGWEISEVKSSTSVKDVYINDVGIQYYVLTGLGFAISKTTVVHINNEYIRDGVLDIQALFKTVDVTEDVRERQSFLLVELATLRKTLGGKMPERDIGPHCSDPYDCDFRGHCWRHIPEYSIFNISRLNHKIKFELYYQGIVKFVDIPGNYHLSDSQRLQVECELNGNGIIIREEIRLFLDTLWFPLYFLDFETFQQPVPLFDVLKPYQQIPFQYSLHYLPQADAEVCHKEFLALEGSDPRRELSEKLVFDIPENACVLVYNQGFEKGVIKNLAELYTDLSTKLLKIHTNINDLMLPFQKKHYYTPDMKGSYSIKSVLPAVVPELSYDGLEIANGGEAMNAYATLHLVSDMELRQKIRENLLNYCRLDTLAMVKIWEKLSKI